MTCNICTALENEYFHLLLGKRIINYKAANDSPKKNVGLKPNLKPLTLRRNYWNFQNKGMRHEKYTNKPIESAVSKYLRQKVN